MLSSVTFAALATLVLGTAARDIPPNVKALYDSIVSKGECSNKLASGFYSQSEGEPGKSLVVVEVGQSETE